MWDMNFFGLYQGDVLHGGWQIFARGIATTFLFVMGVSMTLSYASYEQKMSRPAPFRKYLRRGLQVFGLGLIITMGTYFFVGSRFVIFGILHLLGASIILAYPFLTLNRWLTLLSGVAIMAAGIYVDRIVVDHPWLIWLGLKQSGRAMVDFYPLLPWFGIAPDWRFCRSQPLSTGSPKV